jgi:hypothetical protein
LLILFQPFAALEGLSNSLAQPNLGSKNGTNGRCFQAVPALAPRLTLNHTGTIEMDETAKDAKRAKKCT